jgi:5-methylcytosine-specific restriction endonuclease McrA
MGFFDPPTPKKTRKAFPKTIKDAVIRLQNNKCKKCGKAFTSTNRAQFDHKNGKNWDNSLRNCQALHAGCHDVKSRKASSTRATTQKKKAGFFDPSKPVKFGNFSF